MQRLRLAFLGVDHPHGADWRELLLNFDAQIQVTAIVPGFDGATTSLEERLSAATRFENVSELISVGEFDAALVCLPNNETPTVVCQLAQAGKHVLVEKPGAACAADALEIVEAVKKSNIALQTGYGWRYDEGGNRLREMVRQGRFGKLISIEMTFVTSDVNCRGPDHYLFRRDVSGGGYFNWLACHFLDLLLYVTGQAVVAVTARTGVFGSAPVEVEDGGVAILDLEGGGIATLLGGYWLPRWAGETHWCIRGSQRWVHWNADRPGTGGVLEIHGPKPQWHAMEETFTVPEDLTRGYGGRNGVALVNDWLTAIREGSRTCRNTPDSMLKALQLLDTIDQASKEGRRIECRIEP